MSTGSRGKQKRDQDDSPRRRVDGEGRQDQAVFRSGQGRSSLQLCGDGGCRRWQGKVGWGYGKANEVPPSVEKAVKEGMRSMKTIARHESTIPHVVKGHYGAAEVILVPASPGTGVIAGAAVRAVCEAAGIHDILTKCFGSTNPVTLVKATMAALEQLRPKYEIERLRGVTLS